MAEENTAATQAATIRYNGETLLSLARGQKVTLHCAHETMVTDIVVETADSNDANIAPLTVTKNGTYDAGWETAEATWDAGTAYDFTVTIDGATMRVKKAASFTVPDDISGLLRPEYTITLKLPDGTENAIPLSELDMVETMGCYMSNELLFAVVWIKDATAINETYGTAFEDNTVYFTDFLFTYMDGLSDCELTLAAPGRKLDGFFPVVVNVQGSGGTPKPCTVVEVTEGGIFESQNKFENVVNLDVAVSAGYEKYYLFFLYNGVRLPRIPADMLSSGYAYLMVLRLVETGSTYAYATTTKPYYDGTSKLQLDSGRKRRLYDADADSWGDANESTTSTYCDMAGKWEVVWSDFDIPNGSADATDIYFDGTDPVPTD